MQALGRCSAHCCCTEQASQAALWHSTRPAVPPANCHSPRPPHSSSPSLYSPCPPSLPLPFRIDIPELHAQAPLPSDRYNQVAAPQPQVSLSIIFRQDAIVLRLACTAFIPPPQALTHPRPPV